MLLWLGLVLLEVRLLLLGLQLFAQRDDASFPVPFIAWAQCRGPGWRGLASPEGAL